MTCIMRFPFAKLGKRSVYSPPPQKKKTKQKKQQQKKDVHYSKKHHEVSSDTITAGQVPSEKKKYQATFQTQKN